MAFIYEQQRQKQISLLFASVFRVKDFHIQPTIQNEMWKQGNFGFIWFIEETTWRISCKMLWILENWRARTDLFVWNNFTI